MMQENKSVNFLIIIITLLVLIIGSLSGCVVNPIDNPQIPERGFFMGILPNAPDLSMLEQSYEIASNHCEFAPVWSSGAGAEGFWDYADKLNGWWGDTFLTGYIRGNNMFPIIHFSFIDKNPDTGDLILKTPSYLEDATLNDVEWRALYLKSVVDVVRAVKPLYISVGNEVNRWYEAYGAEENDENGFQHFISLYEEIYDDVKAVSPDTQVFCVFSREMVSENIEADLTVLNMFDSSKIDVLVFTSYPVAIASVNLPSDIPDDYYLKALDYMPRKPFGFSELGWPAMPELGGEQAQSDFLLEVSSNLTIDQGIDLLFFGYCWLYDLVENDTTGLISFNEVEKLGYQTWKQISNSS
jgi:hypothetical protein